MSRISILHVNDVSNVASNLVEGQKELGIKAEIFHITKLLPDSRRKELLALPFKKIGNGIKLKRYVREHGFDIIHVHFATQAWIALIAGLPYYLHVHGSDVRRYLYSPGYGLLIRIAIKKAKKVFYVTPELKHHLAVIRPDAIFLPNPINLDSFKPNKSAVLLNKRVLCISKMDRFKGLEDLFRTIELIWSSQPDVFVAMFGFGNMMDLAQPFFTKHQNNPRLSIISHVPYAQMLTLINSYDLILGHQCTEYGSLSCSELEAMACEKPVVVRFLYPEAYPEPPPVSVSLSAEEASTDTIQLLDNPILARSLGKAARVWVEKNHEQGRIVRILLNYYQQII